MIDRATVDRIMDAVRIEEVIGDFVSLRKRGANYLGLCPFHQDKNPSMSVSSTKGIFKCFACGKAGNAVSFLMEHEHLTYWEALRYLAKKYHIEIVEKEETPEEIAHRMRYESLLVVTDYAQKYFSDILWNTQVGQAIGLSYFHERKFSDETIRKFGLGYAASRPLTLCGKALQDGYKAEYLVAAGLCLEREGTGELYDRFFDRVIFPIHSISGRVIAFGGRTLKTDKSVAKYVNSPQSEIYDKSRSLYGIFQAKNSIAKADKCILVEGYADVISMHQAGVTNVVASSGTSLTVEQIRLIKRFTDKITIIYDGDSAGIKAALRGIDLVLEEGLSVKVVLLPPEADSDLFAALRTLRADLSSDFGIQSQSLASTDALAQLSVERPVTLRGLEKLGILPPRTVAYCGGEIVRTVRHILETKGQTPTEVCDCPTCPDGRLLALLMKCRAEISKRIYTPGNRIISDATLRHMSQAKPINRTQLTEIVHLGQAKCLVFGRAFLRVIREYVNADNVPDGFEGAPEADPALFDALAQLRHKTAQREDKFDSSVMSDYTLYDICIQRPRNEEDLRGIYGIGELKAKKYAAAFVACVENFEKNPH